MVGDVDRLIGIIDDGDGRDRTERLLFAHRHIGGDVGKKRRFVAGTLNLSSGEDLCPVADGLVDARAHLLQRLFVDQRADDRVHLRRTADLEALGLGDQLLGELFRDRALDDDASRGHTDLPLMQESAERGGVDGVLEVGVREHDQRILAAKFEHHPLQMTRRLLCQDPTRLR